MQHLSHEMEELIVYKMAVHVDTSIAMNDRAAPEILRLWRACLCQQQLCLQGYLPEPPQ